MVKQRTIQQQSSHRWLKLCLPVATMTTQRRWQSYNWHVQIDERTRSIVFALIISLVVKACETAKPSLTLDPERIWNDKQIEFWNCAGIATAMLRTISWLIVLFLLLLVRLLLISPVWTTTVFHLVRGNSSCSNRRNQESNLTRSNKNKTIMQLIVCILRYRSGIQQIYFDLSIPYTLV